MTRPRLLDLFCGAGGAGMGYFHAGFDVVGVDIKPQPNYPFEFHQSDALQFLRERGNEFDAIHASPPCQAHSAMKTMHNAKSHKDSIPEVRHALFIARESWQTPYVIENVPNAPLENPTLLCGTMFGLVCDGGELIRHRIFETSFSHPQPTCKHGGKPSVIGIYGGHVRNRKRSSGDRGLDGFTVEQAKEAMGIQWMTLTELCQAIPPAYTEHMGRWMMHGWVTP